jgi:DNA mismatch endonuclease (patch repair protein)
VAGRVNIIGVTLDKDVYRQIVHESARAYMSASNPMFNPETVEKVKRWRETHPDEFNRTQRRFLEGRQRIQKGRATNVQKRLWRAIETAGLTFEKEHIVKPKFIVDAAFPEQSLIVELDGCYWHGHECRFNELTERQEKQQKRDRARDKYLKTCGWTVLRFWECDFNKDPGACIERVLSVLYPGPSTQLGFNFEPVSGSVVDVDKT